jgi:hypothetical protein
MATPNAPPISRPGSPDRLRHLAAGLTAVMAGLYILIFAGVLSIGAAEAGELGVLGVAGVIFVLLAVLLWQVQSRVLWGLVAVLQVAMGAMYVAVAPERDPAFEVWGVTIRALSLVLVGLLLALLGQAWRARRTG